MTYYVDIVRRADAHVERRTGPLESAQADAAEAVYNQNLDPAYYTRQVPIYGGTDAPEPDQTRHDGHMHTLIDSTRRMMDAAAASGPGLTEADVECFEQVSDALDDWEHERRATA